MSSEPPPSGAPAAEKTVAPPVPPALGGELSEEQRTACLALVYCALKLTLEAKKKMSAEERMKLSVAVADVLEAGCTAFPLAVAVWLRNKKELGNRLISTNLLAECTHCEAMRPYVRQTAALVLRLPTDLTEFMAEYDLIGQAKRAGDGKTRPACVKKIARDILEALPPYQAAKYDSRTKIARTRQQLKAVNNQLAAMGVDIAAKGNATTPNPNLGKGGGNPLSKNSFKKGASAEANAKNLQKRAEDLTEKLAKLQVGDLGNLIRYAHPDKPHKLMMSILRKRYPENEDDFIESGLPGPFDPSLMGLRLRVETPPTWDRELSDKGNLPTTWASLLKAKDEKHRYTMPYMALLRNLRNILLMGFRQEFLREHVISRLSDLRQIQGSGQTPVSLSHTWTTLEKEFADDRLKEMKEQAFCGMRDILAYKLLLRKIRGPILGTSDKQVGIIGEFLGEPVWGPCGLQRKKDCFLALNRVLLRGGMVLDEPPKGKGKGKGGGKGKSAPKQEKWLPVACHPVSESLMEEFRLAFDKAIQAAATCATAPICFEGSGPVVCWMDLSNPPLAKIGGDSFAEAKADAKEKKEAKSAEKGDDAGYPSVDPWGEPGGAKVDPSVDLSFAGLRVTPDVVTVKPGEEVELDEISTHRFLCLELRYFCSSYLDYNVMAYDSSGSHLWNSTFSNVEIKNKDGAKCCVHCRDIAGNPSPTEPALRTLHIDLDAFDDNVLALMITSQIYSGVRPSAVSVALRECHVGGCASVDGNHQPHDCKGKLLLAADISAPLKQGGTVVYACIYRDPSDPQSFLFRNTLDLSLGSESRVACQIEQATGIIFRQMFRESALSSTMDANRIGYVRLCQLYQAASAASRPKKAGGKGEPVQVRIFLSGVKKKSVDPEVVELTLSGEYVKDLETIKSCKKQFSGKAVDANLSLGLVLKAAGDTAPAAVVRVANNSHVPAEELAVARKRSGAVFPYATIDARGHIFDAFRELPELERAVFVPGQVESCVTILRNVLAQLEGGSNPVPGAELVVRYVDSFLPRSQDNQKADADDDVGP